MRNSFLLYFLIALFLFLSARVNAQFINSKLNVYAGYSIGKFVGSPTIQESNFSQPALFPNFTSLHGYSVKALYQVFDHVSVGVGTTMMAGSGWSSSEQIYDGTSVNLVNASAHLAFHSRFAAEGISNRLRFSMELVPSIGNASLINDQGLYLFYSSNGMLIPIPSKSSNKYYGLGGDLGLEFTFTQLVGIHVSYALDYHWIKASLYADEHFVTSKGTLGLYVRFMKDRRYFY